MRLLAKWLKPEVIPSPRRKNIPFREKLRLFLYKRCILILKKWYSRSAFSDSIYLNGISPIKLIHEYRDYDFENELSRLHIPLSIIMVEYTKLDKSVKEKNKRRLHERNFNFKDRLYLEVDGQAVSICHGQGRLFDSDLRGKLKESDKKSSIAQYVFTGSLNNIKSSYSSKETPNGDVEQPVGVSSQSKKMGGLFGGDPLLEKKTDISNNPKKEQPSYIKIVEGVEIDESF